MNKISINLVTKTLLRFNMIHVFILLIIISFFSCDNDDDPNAENIRKCYCCDNLPEITDRGVDSLGFIYNDTVWICKGEQFSGWSLTFFDNYPNFKIQRDCNLATLTATRSCRDFNTWASNIIDEELDIVFNQQILSKKYIPLQADSNYIEFG